MIWNAKLPRIVCTACLAEVKVHDQFTDALHDEIVVWAECHERNLLIAISGEALCAHQAHPERDLLLQNLTDVSSHAADLFARAEERMLAAGARADWLNRYLRGTAPR